MFQTGTDWKNLDHIMFHWLLASMPSSNTFYFILLFCQSCPGNMEYYCLSFQLSLWLWLYCCKSAFSVSYCLKPWYSYLITSFISNGNAGRLFDCFPLFQAIILRNPCVAVNNLLELSANNSTVWLTPSALLTREFCFIITCQDALRLN